MDELTISSDDLEKAKGVLIQISIHEEGRVMVPYIPVGMFVARLFGFAEITATAGGTILRSLEHRLQDAEF